MRRTVIMGITFALTVPLLLLGKIPLAHAAIGCVGPGCTGLRADETTCVNDAVIEEQANIADPYTGKSIGNVQLKYSPSCRATWARVYEVLGVGPFTQYAAWAKDISTGNEPTQQCTTSGVAGTSCNTYMLDDVNPLKSYGQGGAPGSNVSFNSATTSPPF